MQAWCSRVGHWLSDGGRGAALAVVATPLEGGGQDFTSPRQGLLRQAAWSSAPQTAALLSINGRHENHAAINRNC